MQASKSWKKLFTKKYLRNIFNEKIVSSTSVGLDKISVKKFEQSLDENLEIILRKVNNASYKFTRYKMLLFSKGPNKNPRQICIPTVRDKLVSAVLNEILTDVYEKINLTPLPHVIINDIIQNCGSYQCYIKLDISGFYGSICHEKLIRIIKRRIRKKELVHLIENAIQTKALYYPLQARSSKGLKRELGIPEGLSISNSLANIYLMGIDEKYKSIHHIKYYRYVDDILIFTNQEDSEAIKKEIQNDIKKLCLELSKNKYDSGLVNDSFEYLGYNFEPGKVSVREKSVLKIEQSIEDLFKKLNGKNTRYIEWKLNLKITGFVWNQHKYGWLFFYSQITDMSVLFHLDSLIQRFCQRYSSSTNQLKVKRFVRTYMEIRKALHKTRYVPNIDRFTIEHKKEILESIHTVNLDKMTERDIEFEFSKIMKREIRDIERDIQHFS